MTGPAVILLVAWIAAVLAPFALAFIVWRLLRLNRASLALALAAPVVMVWCLGVWAFLIEPTTLTVRHVTIESAQWHGPPVRIGLISDTHVAAPHTDPQRIRRLVAAMNAESPDMVVLLGDYVGSHEPAAERSAAQRDEILEGVMAFGGLRSPLGTYGVLGNHDSWFDEALLARTMRQAGVRVLQNQASQIDRPGEPFWVGGVADLHSQRLVASVPRTLHAVPPEAPVILLTHWPDPFEDVPGRVALTLAGHTHCGQVDLPLIGRPILPSPGSYRWPCGLYYEDGRPLFVTGGVGVSILPVRFRAPPEIVIVTLRAALSGD